MPRNESSRFVQTLIREESRSPLADASTLASPNPPARMQAGAISRLIGAIGRRSSEPPASASDTTVVRDSVETTLFGKSDVDRSASTVINQTDSSMISGSYEVGGDTPVTATTRSPITATTVASIASATRPIERPTPTRADVSPAIDEIRSATKLSVSLPLATPMAESRGIIRNDVHPDAGGNIRFAHGVDEIFDQVWVKVQRRIGKPHQPDLDVEETGIEHRNIQSIVVTSWAEDEGTSTVALGLAGRAANSMPGRICLVDADFLERGLTRASSLNGQRGLAELITQEASLDDVIVEGKGSPFAFVPAGNGADPSVLSTDARLQDVIRSLEERYRYVFYDVSSLKRGVEAYRWGRFVVNTILVVRAGTTRRQTIRHAVDQIQLHGMDLLGTILNERVDVIPNWIYPYI
ncbi:CpsD/CapB family tyrosine-protein kinase [bacterium]|nr:CpsD/CapB family tyrosine-protein kinase [bacterium]